MALPWETLFYVVGKIIVNVIEKVDKNTINLGSCAIDYDGTNRQSVSM